MTPIPVDELRANVEKLGRPLDDAEFIGHGWRGDEYGLEIRWPDGFVAWVGMGAQASAVIESTFHTRRH